MGRPCQISFRNATDVGQSGSGVNHHSWDAVKTKMKINSILKKEISIHPNAAVEKDVTPEEEEEEEDIGENIIDNNVEEAEEKVEDHDDEAADDDDNDEDDDELKMQSSEDTCRIPDFTSSQDSRAYVTPSKHVEKIVFSSPYQPHEFNRFQ